MLSTSDDERLAIVPVKQLSRYHQTVAVAALKKLVRAALGGKDDRQGSRSRDRAGVQGER